MRLGLSILQWLNQNWFWTISDLRWLLYGILALSVLFALSLRYVSQTPRALAITAGVVGLAVVAWNLTGEISAAHQADCAGEVSALADPDASRTGSTRRTAAPSRSSSGGRCRAR